MKKYIFSILSLFVIALSGLSLTACSEDDLVTDQYKQGVNLNVFGPSPVMRGGVLRFLGSNLDQIESITLPGCNPITAIEVVQAGIPSEIRITVPKDGPEEGYILLTTKTGDQISTQTPIAYEEPIVIESFTPAEAMPGDVVTIKGDYLNLIHMVEFADGVQVGEEEFVKHDRYEIQVVVPETAQTGKLALYDADLTKGTGEGDVSYNIMETDEALIVGTPVVSKLKGRAEVAALGEITAKQGEQIVITGEYYSLVSAVTIGGVQVTEFEVAKDGKSLTLTLPAEAPDGDINLVCKSGVEVPAGTLVTVAPSELTVSPAPVKNGSALTIAGKDLDVVVSVTFPNADVVSEIQVTAEKLIVTVPETAQEGEVALNMANGKSVTVAYTLVKPTVTEYNPSPAAAGGALEIKGTDLDLVASVAFGSSTQKEVSASADGTVLTLKVPLDAESGNVILKLKNGTSVECEALDITKPEFCFIPDVTILTDNELKAGDLLVVEAENMDVLTEVQIDGEKTKYVDNGGKLYIAITANAGKKSVLKLISEGVGEVEYALSVTPNTEKHTIIWTGAQAFMDWNGMQDLAYGGYDWSLVTPGTEMIIHATVIDPTVGWGCVSIRHGNQWSNVEGLPGQYDFAMEPADITIVVELTETVLNDLRTNDGMIVMGHNFMLSSIELVEHISVETTLWEGEAVCDDWGNQPYLLSDGGIELQENGAKVGSVLRFYITPTAEAWNMQIVEGHWSGVQYCDFNQDNWDLAANGGAIAITVTQAMLDAAYTVGGWGGTFIGNGDNAIITKITIE